MRVRVLYFDGCPNFKAAVDLVQSLAPHALIEEVEVKTTDDAQRMRFLGSPTILIDGVDVEPGARMRTDFGFSCRTYNGKGVPSRELLASAIAANRSSLSSFEQSGSLWLAASSIAVGVVASICCWLPLVLLAFGASAVGMSDTVETLRPWLFTGAATLLAAAFYVAYRKQSCCAGGCNRTMAWIAAAMLLALALFPRYGGALIDAARGPVCCVSPDLGAAADQQTTPSQPGEAKVASSAAKAAALTDLSGDAHELKDAFNDDKGAVRVVLIVSPRCPMCRAGAREVQEKALAQIDSDKLKVYVVWIPRFPFDNRQAAQSAVELVPDPRARHFWDGSGRLGKEYGKIVKLPGKRDFAWDVYFVFDSKSVWTDVPPTPDFWMHQLGGFDTGNRLDGAKFRDAIAGQPAKE